MRKYFLKERQKDKKKKITSFEPFSLQKILVFQKNCDFTLVYLKATMEAALKYVGKITNNSC